MITNIPQNIYPHPQNHPRPELVYPPLTGVILLWLILKPRFGTEEFFSHTLKYWHKHFTSVKVTVLKLILLILYFVVVADSVKSHDLYWFTCENTGENRCTSKIKYVSLHRLRATYNFKISIIFSFRQYSTFTLQICLCT